MSGPGRMRRVRRVRPVCVECIECVEFGEEEDGDDEEDGDEDAGRIVSRFGVEGFGLSSGGGKRSAHP